MLFGMAQPKQTWIKLCMQNRGIFYFPWNHSPSEMKFMTWWIFMNNSWIYMNYSWTAIIFRSWTKVHELFMNNLWIIHEYARIQKYSWNIHEPKFMNQVSWILVTPVHERFVNNLLINMIHEIFMKIHDCWINCCHIIFLTQIVHEHYMNYSWTNNFPKQLIKYILNIIPTQFRWINMGW